MKKTILPILSLVVVPATADAKQLIQIGNTADGSVYFADYDTIDKRGVRAEIWIEIDHSKDKTTKARRSKELWKFNCEAKTSMTAYWVSYDPDGRVIKSGGEIDNSYLYEPVVPDTFGSFAMNLSCTSPK